MGSSDRSRRKSAHVKSKLGPAASNGPGRGSESGTGASSGGSGAGPGPHPGPGPGPTPPRKFIAVEIDDVDVSMARRIKLGAEVLFLYRPSVVTVVWHQDRLGKVASKHEDTVREHRPSAATITRLLASGQRMKAAFRARA